MIGILVFTPCLIHKELSTLGTSKSPEPDQLHSKMLKCLVTFLVEPLAGLFNNPLATVVEPSDWNAAVICPIFKKGDLEDVVRCRPVSLPSVLCKVFERILKRVSVSAMQ